MANVGKVTICKDCGNEFIATSIADKYCCKDCKQQARKKSKRKSIKKIERLKRIAARELKIKEREGQLEKQN